MDYVRLLVDKGLVDSKAVEAVQAQRDPPGHGKGVRSVGTGAS